MARSTPVVAPLMVASSNLAMTRLVSTRALKKVSSKATCSADMPAGSTTSVAICGNNGRQRASVGDDKDNTASSGIDGYDGHDEYPSLQMKTCRRHACSLYHRNA